MAFDIRNLDPLGSGSGGAPCMGGYTTSDAFSVVEADGYFDEAYSSLQTGSMLIVRSTDESDGGTNIYVLTVTSNDVSLTNYLAALDARVTALESA